MRPPLYCSDRNTASLNILATNVILNGTPRDMPRVGSSSRKRQPALITPDSDGDIEMDSTEDSAEPSTAHRTTKRRVPTEGPWASSGWVEYTADKWAEWLEDHPFSRSREDYTEFYRAVCHKGSPLLGSTTLGAGTGAAKDSGR